MSLEKTFSAFQQLRSLIPDKFYKKDQENILNSSNATIPTVTTKYEKKNMQKMKTSISMGAHASNKSKNQAGLTGKVPLVAPVSAAADNENVTETLENINILPQSAIDHKSILAHKIKLLQEKRNAGATSRLDLLQKRRDKKLKKKKLQKSNAVSFAANKKITDTIQDANKEEVKEGGDILFGKVEFGTEADEKLKKGPTDAAGLLRIAENKQKKLKELQESGQVEKAQTIQEKQKWKSLELQVSGVNPKDDIKLLKKSLKRQQSEKKKSKKEWDDRLKQADHIVKQRQDKRQANIQKRKDDNMARKKTKKKAHGFK